MVGDSITFSMFNNNTSIKQQLTLVIKVVVSQPQQGFGEIVLSVIATFLSLYKKLSEFVPLFIGCLMALLYKPEENTSKHFWRISCSDPVTINSIVPLKIRLKKDTGMNDFLSKFIQFSSTE